MAAMKFGLNKVISLPTAVVNLGKVTLLALEYCKVQSRDPGNCQSLLEEKVLPFNYSNPVEPENVDETGKVKQGGFSIKPLSFGPNGSFEVLLQSATSISFV